MNRVCPNCAERFVSTKDLLFGNCRCGNCHCIVGVRRLVAAVANLVIFTVAIVTTLIVFIELDLYAALLWFTLPVGALSYLKIRFCPLEVKPEPYRSGGSSGAAHRSG